MYFSPRASRPCSRLEIGQERVDLLAQFVVALADADGPVFLLERFEHRAGGLRVLLVELEDGHLVVDERIRLALDHFQHARRLLGDAQDLRLRESVPARRWSRSCRP